MLALTTLGAALSEALLLHAADDGCVVEVHCLACRWAATAAGASLTHAEPRPRLTVAGPVELRSSFVPTAVAPKVAVSRGPPSV